MKLIAIVLIAALPTVAVAEWTADPSDKVQVRASTAVAAFRDSVPRTEPFFEKAYGYAIYPSITRIGFGFGGAYGKGIIVAGDTVTGHSKYWQFTSGIQAGARNFSKSLLPACAEYELSVSMRLVADLPAPAA